MNIHEQRSPASPRFPGKVLKALLRRQGCGCVLGDLEEEYRVRVAARGHFRAALWYWGQCIWNLGPVLRLHMDPHWAIWRLDFNTTLRRLIRQKQYLLINTVGLALGLAVVLFILTWIRDEKGYDRQLPNASRVCRVISVHGDSRIPVGPGPLAQYLKDEIPEIVESTRFHSTGGLYLYGDKALRLKGLRVEPSFFKVFGWPLLQGEEQGAMDEIGDMVLTASTAERFFGEADPIGKVLRVERRWSGTVNGVMADVPRQTSPPLQFDFLESFALYYRIRQPNPDSWEGAADYNVYVLLNDKARVETVNQKIEAMLRRHNVDEHVHLVLEPITRVRLHANCTRWDGPHGDIRYVRLFSGIAGLILFLAVINYINLATARSLTRLRELSFRMVLGARPWLLARQTLLESMLLTWVAGLVGFGFFLLGLPLFNRWSGINFSPAELPISIWACALIALTALGIAAGIVPALMLVRRRPMLPGSSAAGGERRAAGRLREALVVMQFILTIGILASGVAIYGQLRFILNYPLGFAHEHIVLLPTGGEYPYSAYTAFRQEISRHPNVMAVGSCYHVPDGDPAYTGVSWSRDGQQHYAVQPVYRVDEHYLSVFGIDLLQGRFFKTGEPGRAPGFVINAAAAEAMGMDNPVGERINVGQDGGVILGVVNDFRFQTLHHAVKPLVMVYERQGDHVDIRIRPGATQPALATLETAFRRHYPELPYAPQFLDARLSARYAGEQRLRQILLVFAGVALTLSALGLYGLAAYTLQRRQREMSIRKVMGAADHRVIGMLTLDFVRWVGLACAVAWLLSGTYIDQWLQQFAVRSPFPWWAMPAAGGAALLVALSAIIGQVLHVSRQNPSDVLRHE